jgi:hypothetical protein
MPRPKWLIEGILKEGTLAVLYGEPKSTKSFIALDWAASLTEGSDWFGFTTPHPRDVVYVQAESPWGLGDRLKAWQEARAGDLARLRFLYHPLNMLDPADRKSLVELVRKEGVEPGLVVLDTMARTFGGGDENSSQDMGKFIRNADLLKEELGTAVLVVHHPGRNVRRGPRGSTALYGALDTLMLLKKVNAERSADGTGKITALLSCEDQKDAPCFDPHAITLTCQDSCVAVEVEPVKGKPMKPKALDNRAKALDALEGDCTSFDDWKRLSGVPQSSFYKVRDKLVQEGAVLQVGECYRKAPAISQ